MNRLLSAAMAVACLCTAVPLHAQPLVPRSDDEVVETLPAASGDRAEERRLRRDWAAHPRDEAKAVALARRYLTQARAEGDPRRAGQALAVLQAWPEADDAPDEVLLMVATIEQYLHEFDASARHLERLLQRQPRHAQAWLTLATVRRVQGRYADSDRACAGLVSAGAALHARACEAENDGLRGRVDGARTELHRLLAMPRTDGATQAWLATTLAELEARAGRASEAEAAYRRALGIEHDAYALISYADFLIAQGRDADARALLRDESETDAVLLRRAIAGARGGRVQRWLAASSAGEAAPGADASPDAQARRDADAVRERTRLASLRPEARLSHAREHAMFALWVDRAPQRALRLARENLRRQREPIDVLLFAQCARAASDSRALADAHQLAKEMDLHDQRLDSLW